MSDHPPLCGVVYPSSGPQSSCLTLPRGTAQVCPTLGMIHKIPCHATSTVPCASESAHIGSARFDQISGLFDLALGSGLFLFCPFYILVRFIINCSCAVMFACWHSSLSPLGARENRHIRAKPRVSYLTEQMLQKRIIHSFHSTGYHL